MEKMEKTYSIYISSFSGKSIEEGASGLAKNFNIPIESAKRILENVPVLFMNNLQRKEVRTLKSRLISVSKYGVEFTISSQELPFLAKVVYKKGTKQIEDIAKNWYNFALTCPNCKNLIILKPAEEIVEAKETKAVERVEQVRGEPIEESQPSYVSPSVEKSVESERREGEEAEIDIEQSRATEYQTEESVGEEISPSLQDTETVETESPSQQPLEEEISENVTEASYTSSQQPEVIEIKEELEEPQVIQTSEQPDYSTEEITSAQPQQEGLVMEEASAVPTEEAPEGVVEETPPLLQEPQAPTMAENEQSTQAVVEEPVKEEYTGPRYRVFISNVTGEEKKEQAAQLICELTGISYEEAIEKFKKVIVPVYHEATEEEANNAIKRFKELKIRATKTKIKSQSS
ncbi:MAG: hypothetical protein ACK4NF_04550 [Planctomycetota bacterium]